MTTQRSITYRDREIHNPILRALTVVAILVGAAVMIPLGMLWAMLIGLATLPIHVALRATGRDGFAHKANGEYSYVVPNWATAAVSVLAAVIVLLQIVA